MSKKTLRLGATQMFIRQIDSVTNLFTKLPPADPETTVYIDYTPEEMAAETSHAQQVEETFGLLEAVIQCRVDQSDPGPDTTPESPAHQDDSDSDSDDSINKYL